MNHLFQISLLFNVIMECMLIDCVNIGKRSSSHSYSELSKTQFFPVSIVKKYGFKACVIPLRSSCT